MTQKKKKKANIQICWPAPGNIFFKQIKQVLNRPWLHVHANTD